MQISEKDLGILRRCVEGFEGDADLLIKELEKGRHLSELYDLRGTLEVNLEVALRVVRKLKGRYV